MPLKRKKQAPAAPAAQTPPPASASTSPKNGTSRGCLITMITGLVAVGVLVVLGLLGVITFPIFSGVKEHQKDKEAREVMKSLDAAVLDFRKEYGRVPFAPDPPPGPRPPLDGDFRESSSEEGRMLLDVLLGQDEKQNPRKRRFWEPPTLKGTAGYSPANGLVDPWGTNGYRIHLDDNGDGQIADPEKVRDAISGSALIYSAGEDGDFLTWKDNVRNWEKRIESGR